ncbi:MAG TPA: pseudouridine synthase [Prosthecobacter sp.]|nr:pseudouridine synthase [Prosthecobacter sp.]
MRLNRYLSQCGLGSRRGCEQVILEGRVSINGRQVKELATQVGPEDQVSVDGKSVRAESGVVIALNKPRGYICTRSDTHDRMTIYDLLPAQYQTLHHVGRLDKESEGLLLLTNRGDLSHRLIHPSQGAEKEYEVVVDKPLDAAVMAKLVKGMLTEEGYAKAERAWLDGYYRAHVVLKQGLKRQIRLMFYQLGFEVERLVRTRIGWLELRGMPKGGWKELSAAEVERFFSKEGGGSRPNNKPVKAAAKKAAPAAIRSKAKFEDETPKRRTSPRPEGDARRRKPGPGERSGPGERGGRSKRAPGQDEPRRRRPSR